MQAFTHYTPTEIVFGKASEDKVAELAKKYHGSRVFVVYGGGSVVKSGLLERVTGTLEAAGLKVETMGGVKPNPRLDFAREAVKKAIEFQADMILAVGGGSVIDTAKAVSHGAANPDTDIWEFWSRKKKVEKTLPVGVILTLAAAGSETSDSAVLTNTEIQVKRGLSTDLNRPEFAIMNPELTYTLPKYQVGCGIVDIMMHTLDRYFTKTKGNQLTDEIAEGLLRTVIANGRIAIQDSHNYESMSEIMWCGSISHNGLTGLGAEKDFAPHQLGHELSAKFDIAHGASLSAVWGAWAEYSCMEDVDRFVRFADKVWGISGDNKEEVAQKAINATVNYFKSLDMPTCFSEAKEIGIKTEDELWAMADGCSYKDTRTIGAFRVLNKEDIFNVYKLANK